MPVDAMAHWRAAAAVHSGRLTRLARMFSFCRLPLRTVSSAVASVGRGSIFFYNFELRGW